jgi:hypothetical protein
VSEIGSALVATVGVERANTYGDELWDLIASVGPHAALRLVAENPANLDLPVVWRFADVVEGGWVSRDAVYRPLPTRAQFLVVTEGNTDALVLRKALALRRPRVADFFYFVDMTENYPFSGTGNLFNFSKGLARIRVENRVLIVYDNDAEGSAKLQASTGVGLPENIRVLALPSLPEFSAFATAGPTGEAVANINGRAASIECYLDLTFGAVGRPIVRWTGFQSSTETYQGALIGKERYAKTFFGLRAGEDEERYDFRKLEIVVDVIIAAAVEMAARSRRGTL